MELNNQTISGGGSPEGQQKPKDQFSHIIFLLETHIKTLDVAIKKLEEEDPFVIVYLSTKIIEKYVNDNNAFPLSGTHPNVLAYNDYVRWREAEKEQLAVFNSSQESGTAIE